MTIFLKFILIFIAKSDTQEEKQEDLQSIDSLRKWLQ